MSSTGRPSADVMLKLPDVDPDTEFQFQLQERVVGAVVLATAIIINVAGVLKIDEVGVQSTTLLDMPTARVPVELPGKPVHATEAEQVR